MRAFRSTPLHRALSLPTSRHSRPAEGAGSLLPGTALPAPRSGEATGSGPFVSPAAGCPHPQLPSPGDTSRGCPASPQPPRRGSRFPLLPSPIAAREPEPSDRPGAGGPRQAAGQTRPGCPAAPRGGVGGVGGATGTGEAAAAPRSATPRPRSPRPAPGAETGCPRQGGRGPAEPVKVHHPPHTPPPRPGTGPSPDSAAPFAHRRLPPPHRAPGTAAPAARRRLPQGGAGRGSPPRSRRAGAGARRRSPRSGR